jgi:hypothetical protein
MRFLPQIPFHALRKPDQVFRFHDRFSLSVPLIVGHLDFQAVDHLVVLSIQREQRQTTRDCSRRDE